MKGVKYRRTSKKLQVCNVKPIEKESLKQHLLHIAKITLVCVDNDPHVYNICPIH